MQDIVYVAIVKECGGFAVSPLTSILYITSFFIPVIEMVKRLQTGSDRAFMRVSMTGPCTVGDGPEVLVEKYIMNKGFIFCFFNSCLMY